MAFAEVVNINLLTSILAHHSHVTDNNVIQTLTGVINQEILAKCAEDAYATSAPITPHPTHPMNPEPTNITAESAPSPPKAALSRHAYEADPTDDLIHLHSLYSPDMPDPDYDFDFGDDGRDRDLLMDDLASDSDDFARSDEEGWYYSDEDSGIDALPDSGDWDGTSRLCRHSIIPVFLLKSGFFARFAAVLKFHPRDYIGTRGGEVLG